MAFAYRIKGRKIELLSQDLSGTYVTPSGNDAKTQGLMFQVTERADFKTQKVSTATAAINASGMTPETYTGITCTGGNGSGCIISVVVTANALTSFEVTSPGIDYIKGDVLDFSVSLAAASSGTVTTATLTIDTTADHIISDGIDEGHDIDVPEYLAKALVYYLRGRFAEDAGEIDQKEYNFHQFEKMIDTHEDNKTHGLAGVVVGNWGIKT